MSDSPLRSHTHNVEQGLGVLAPVDHYTTKGVIGFSKARTLLFFFMMPNCSAHKREGKLFFLYYGFRPKKEKKGG